MATDVDLCNLALFRIGQSQTIASLSENSVPAQACNQIFSFLRDMVLRSFPWPFATQRVTLSQLAVTAPQNWGYVFALPTDCLKARGITFPGNRVPRADLDTPFEVAAMGDQLVIYCDDPAPELVYTSRVVNIGMWDPLAADALSALISAELAMPLNVKPDIAAMARQGFELAMNRAAAHAMSEVRPGKASDPDLLAVRGLTFPFPDYPGGPSLAYY